MRRWALAALVVQWFQHVNAEDTISQEVKYIWPVMTWTVPLTPGLIDASATARLAAIGEEAFDHYVKEILPKELQIDKKWEADFTTSDASRMNLGFVRWQKRVYSKLRRVPLNELSWDGSPIPKYPNVNYEWNELYKSRELNALRTQIERLSSMYLNHIGKDGNRGRRRFRTFIWVEVFRYGDAHRPRVRTGAATSGIFYARYSSSKEGKQKIAFEDARGINPPFGKTHNHQPKEGEIQIFPSWASHFVTPHRTNSTNVYFNFVCWPPDGAPELDWEDDATGDYIFRKVYNIRRPKDAPRPGASNEGRSEL